MRESVIWRLVLGTFVFTALLMLLMRFDGGFLSMAPARAAIPVSTDDRIEIVVTPTAPLSGNATTEIWWLEKGGAFTKKASFQQTPQSVAAVNGDLFMAFRGGDASIFKDAKWVKGVSTPSGMPLFDVAAYQGKVYAVGPVGDSRRIGIRVLGQAGWEEAAKPFPVAKKIPFAEVVAVADGLDVLYGSGPEGSSGQPDFNNTRWYHVHFDGKEWGQEEPLDFPKGFLPCPSSYKDKPAYVLSALEKDAPLRIALLENGKISVVSEIPTRDLGIVSSGWIVPLGGEEHLILTSAGVCLGPDAG